MKVVILFLGLLSAPAVAADQFDLVCEGKLTYSPDKPVKFRTRYRVDLSAMAWCTDDCQEIHKIVEVQPGKIVLKREEATLRSSYRGERVVDRLSGKLSADFSTSTSSLREEAMCTTDGFSGMPSKIF